MLYIIRRKTVVITRAGLWLGITSGEAVAVLRGGFFFKAAPLAHSCDCRCKTSLMWNTPATACALKQLDDSTFGAHFIEGKTTALGLVLFGRAELHPTEPWQPVKQRRLLKQINPKAAEKFCARLRLFKIPVLSVKARSIAFNTFAQSVILYTASYFGTAQADLAML